MAYYQLQVAECPISYSIPERQCVWILSFQHYVNIDKNPQHEPKRRVRDLKRYYQAYKEYQHAPEQFNDCYSLTTISADNPILYSYQYFPVAIGMLKNLRFAQVASHDWKDNFHPVWRNFRREILQGPSERTEYVGESLASFHYADYQLEGVTQLTCLLNALSVARLKVNLRSLKFSTDGHYFWLQEQIKNTPRQQKISQEQFCSNGASLHKSARTRRICDLFNHE